MGRFDCGTFRQRDVLTGYLLVITAHRNARIASAVLATAIPSVRPSARPSDTRRYCVKSTASSTVQFALSVAQCLVL